MTRGELEELRKLRRTVRDLEKDAKRYIKTIEDPYIAEIVRLRYVEGKRWREVSDELGNVNGEDSIRMMCNRYFSSQKS